MNKIDSEKGELTMTKYYICKEHIVLSYYRWLRAEKILQKKVSEWDENDIFDAITNVQIIDFRDRFSKIIRYYDTLESAKYAARNLKSKMSMCNFSLMLTMYYIEEHKVYDYNTHMETCEYIFPCENMVKEVPKDLHRLARILYKGGWSSDQKEKFVYLFELSIEEANELAHILESMFCKCSENRCTRVILVN